MTEVTIKIAVDGGKGFPHCSVCGPLPPVDVAIQHDDGIEYSGIDALVAEHMTFTHHVVQITRKDQVG